MKYIMLGATSIECQLAEDLVDLATRVVDDVEDPLLLIRIGGVRGLRDRTEQLAGDLAEVDLRGSAPQ